MIFTCPECQSRTATPTPYDDVVKQVECGNCGMTLTAAQHGQKTPGTENMTGMFGKARGALAKH